ncbi:hypothetical protein AB0346_18565 [Nocardia beijingensis]|uniref:hypothetical protein n=1 Tax=Nocardia beijingensis TaxID=95162 RepID=UPI00344D8F02
MRWTNYRSSRDRNEHAAVLVDNELLAVEHSLLELLGSDIPLDGWAERALARPWERCVVDDAELLAPIPVPPSVRDFMAFENHVVTSYTAIGTEVSPVWYEQPIFYSSCGSSKN